MFITIKDAIKKIVYKIIPPPFQINHASSFSQAGEDSVIDFLLGMVGIEKPVYLELGVYDPIICNNTYKFYLRGARGVLVDADESLISNIKEKRPYDKIIHCGIGVDDGREADFYIFNLKAINTFSKQEAEKRQQSGQYKIEKIVKVPLLTINKIIENHLTICPDLLSIDIEGFDLEALKTLDYEKYPIPVICAETCTYSENHIKSKDKRIEEFLVMKGYFNYADTYINTIFVNEKWFNSVRNKR